MTEYKIRKPHILGKEIHKLLNISLKRKLKTEEYCELVLLIGNVFDLAKKK